MNQNCSEGLWETKGVFSKERKAMKNKEVGSTIVGHQLI